MMPGGGMVGGGVLVGGAFCGKDCAVRAGGDRGGRLAVCAEFDVDRRSGVSVLAPIHIAGASECLHAGVLPCGYGGQRTQGILAACSVSSIRGDRPGALGILAISGAAGAGVCATADLDGAEHIVVAGGAGGLGWKRDAHWVAQGVD